MLSVQTSWPTSFNTSLSQAVVPTCSRPTLLSLFQINNPWPAWMTYCTTHTGHHKVLRVTGSCSVCLPPQPVHTHCTTPVTQPPRQEKLSCNEAVHWLQHSTLSFHIDFPQARPRPCELDFGLSASVSPYQHQHYHTGAQEHHILSPLPLTLLTHSSAQSSSNHIIKFADDITAKGLH